MLFKASHGHQMFCEKREDLQKNRDFFLFNGLEKGRGWGWPRRAVVVFAVVAVLRVLFPSWCPVRTHSLVSYRILVARLLVVSCYDRVDLGSCRILLRGAIPRRSEPKEAGHSPRRIPREPELWTLPHEQDEVPPWWTSSWWQLRFHSLFLDSGTANTFRCRVSLAILFRSSNLKMIFFEALNDFSNAKSSSLNALTVRVAFVFVNTF